MKLTPTDVNKEFKNRLLYIINHPELRNRQQRVKEIISTFNGCTIPKEIKSKLKNIN